jgi:hypothetical protein
MPILSAADGWRPEAGDLSALDAAAVVDAAAGWARMENAPHVDFGYQRWNVVNRAPSLAAAGA